MKGMETITDAAILLARVGLGVIFVAHGWQKFFTLGLTTVLDVVVVFLVTWPLVYLASKSTMFAKPALNGLGAVQQVARERRSAAAATGRE